MLDPNGEQYACIFDRVAELHGALVNRKEVFTEFEEDNPDDPILGEKIKKRVRSVVVEEKKAAAEPDAGLGLGFGNHYVKLFYNLI